ncbi:hypothetical protein V2G26_015181 [Clonostachys chloroleuca]
MILSKRPWQFPRPWIIQRKKNDVRSGQRAQLRDTSQGFSQPILENVYQQPQNLKNGYRNLPERLINMSLRPLASIFFLPTHPPWHTTSEDNRIVINKDPRLSVKGVS